MTTPNGRPAPAVSALRTGTRVRAHVKAAKYDGRVGIVIGHNLGEVGVSFTRSKVDDRSGADAWFLPSELTIA